MVGTGYELTKAFYAEVEQNEGMQKDCKPHHQSLYTWICELRNRTKREVLDLPVLYTMQMTFIGSQHTLAKAISDLAEWGIINVLMQTKGQGTKVKFAIAFMQKHCNSGTITEGEAIADMQLQCNYSAIEVQTTKRNKKDKTDEPTKADGFDLFWNHYGKKTGSKPAALKEWNKLSTQEQLAAHNTIDKYKAYQPDAKYRKDPERYLKGRLWESEFDVKPNPQTYNQTPQSVPSTNRPFREFV